MQIPTDKRERATHHGPRFGTALDSVVLVACAAMSLAFVAPPDSSSAPLPDFGSLSAPERKAAFFDYLRPLVEEANRRAAADGDFVQAMQALQASGQDFSAYQAARIEALAARYQVSIDDADPASGLETLRRRTGKVPVSLAMIQAAKESGWGTSRFAVEGNNLFGQRCYENGCGIRPKRQADGAGWGVASYDSVAASLESYLMNLNTHPEYSEFRTMRQRMRSSGETLDGHDLAESLDSYSERGVDYVAEIQSMIRQNGLD